MSSADPRARRDAGFTLLELMVALTLTVLLGSIVFEVVRGQSRFATVQNARQEVQQNSRGAVEILASELRSAQSSGLVSATASSITFAVPRIWGVSCGASAGVLYAVFPDMTDSTSLFTLNGASGLMADTSAAGSGQWGPTASPSSASRATVTALTVQDLNSSTNPCQNLFRTANAGIVRGVSFTGTNIPATGARQGNTLYLYQVVKYDVAEVSGERWIRRSNGLPSDANMQPLAGPVASATGLVLTYYDASGNDLGSPGTDAALLAQVRRIRISVTTQSRTKGSTGQTDTQATLVTLRNQ